MNFQSVDNPCHPDGPHPFQSESWSPSSHSCIWIIVPWTTLTPFSWVSNQTVNGEISFRIHSDAMGLLTREMIQVMRIYPCSSKEPNLNCGRRTKHHWKLNYSTVTQRQSLRWAETGRQTERCHMKLGRAVQPTHSSVLWVTSAPSHSLYPKSPQEQLMSSSSLSTHSFIIILRRSLPICVFCSGTSVGALLSSHIETDTETLVPFIRILGTENGSHLIYL